MGILLYALNLRGPIIALAPVLDLITTGLGISAATAGLLAGIPVFFFALAVPLASFLMRKVGLEAAVSVSLALVLLGTIIRSLDGAPGAFIGMAIIGTAITIGNVTVPVIIGRDFPTAVSTVSGMYAAALNVGSVLTTLGTAPLASLVGWRWALALWGILAVGAGIVWRAATARIEKAGELDVPIVPGQGQEGDPVRHRWDAWALLIMFGAQSFTYYGITAWLPTLLSDEHGLSPEGAGAYSMVFQLFGILGALGVPFVLNRRVPLRAVSVVMSVFFFALPIGLLLAPGWFLVWMMAAGIAQGGNFTVIITLVVQRSRSQAENRRMSAFVQGWGYTFAAFGPYVVGSVHSVSGGWTWPLVVTLVTLAAMATAAFLLASAGPYQNRIRSIEI